MVLNKDLRIVSANEAFYNAFKVAPNDTENRLLYDLGNRQWNIPKLRVLLEEILPEKNTIEDFVVEHDFKDIGQKTMPSKPTYQMIRSTNSSIPSSSPPTKKKTFP